eukprot:CAMPEP_0201284360 /NCGR_PEP_ID=MMETSP1317-20130820/71381_1 /ASSEMBLY_ACC=CAM_ASM_000770 /TAXON_ID=187299 /ORGANISM="Undescribed Undescribed, Strain Undescribed" /LENGTH=112 /DNA_ID=CAMNT_0047604213 /DNA_START=72 /DNA_END=407 /DNA_ORIENTATION=-
MNFRTGAARSGIAHGPEIFFLAEPYYSSRRQILDLFPQLKRLIILAKNRYPEPGRIKTEFAGQKFPGKINGILLEIITKGKVAQHFEKGMVPGGMTDIFQIIMFSPGTYAAL